MQKAAPASRREDERRRKDDGKQSSYDPGSAFQLIGNGDLTEAQKRNLTDDEQRKLDD
jgi:hypothetical protein